MARPLGRMQSTVNCVNAVCQGYGKWASLRLSSYLYDDCIESVSHVRKKQCHQGELVTPWTYLQEEGKKGPTHIGFLFRDSHKNEEIGYDYEKLLRHNAIEVVGNNNNFEAHLPPRNGSMIPCMDKWASHLLKLDQPQPQRSAYKDKKRTDGGRYL